MWPTGVCMSITQVQVLPILGLGPSSAHPQPVSWDEVKMYTDRLSFNWKIFNNFTYQNYQYEGSSLVTLGQTCRRSSEGPYPSRLRQTSSTEGPRGRAIQDRCLNSWAFSARLPGPLPTHSADPHPPRNAPRRLDRYYRPRWEVT